VIAGPNGAGKSTTAPEILRGALGVDEFVNADVIANGLSAFNPQAVAITAGRAMLKRLHELAAARANFAFETTLASRSFAPWLAELQKEGYAFHLVYVWLSAPKVALARVESRVRMGGHFVPPETIQRRYYRGLLNFFDLYLPLATTWECYDNSKPVVRTLIATGGKNANENIHVPQVWKQICQGLVAARQANQRQTDSE
jgi:predicted ABC-type ATPase